MHSGSDPQWAVRTLRSGGVPGTDAAQRCGVVALDLWLNEWKEKMQNEKETDTRRASQNSLSSNDEEDLARLHGLSNGLSIWSERSAVALV